MIPESVVQKLRTSLRGETFCPDKPGYDEARTIPNAMIDRRPAMIARCAGAADVIACVREAREHDLLVSVRGGGHSIAGKAVCEDGLRPYLVSGAYGNYVTDEGEAIAREAYGCNYDRLVAQKSSTLRQTFSV